MAPDRGTLQFLNSKGAQLAAHDTTEDAGNQLGMPYTAANGRGSRHG